VISGVSASAAATSATVTWSTNEPADSRVEYGPSTAYGQTRSQPTLTISHSLELSGLDCATSYHYRVSSADAAGNRATGEDGTFSTGACQPPPPSWVRGDEFDGSTLDTSVWRVVNPAGDASVSVGAGRLRVSLPAGRAHDLWEGALDAPRVLGAAADADFEIEAKYDSAVSETYQSQGLVAQSDFDDFVRFDVHSSGGAMRLFAATFVGGSATVRLQETIQGGAPIYLRMQRSGAVWTLRYSLTGSSWTTAASFNFPLALHEFGVFAGNPGPAPAFMAEVDHFRVLSEGQPPPPPPGDTTPPVLSGVAAAPGSTTATVTWTTDEPADSRVEYGPTTAYGQTRSGSALVTSHSIGLSGLTCATTYHYRVSSADAAGNRATGGDRTFTTGACVPSTGPAIEIWYGDSQRFGDPGIAQRWFNILGKATDPDGLARIDYRVDSGPRINLVFDTAGFYWRIGAHGDFNIELDRFALSPGQHVVTITASDRLGNESTRSVNVEVVGGRTWPLPYETTWAAGLQRTAQIVDGRWALDGDGVRSIVPGYDRTIAIGDETWASVDATVPVTIHAFNASADHAGVGIAAGWRGHEGTESPRNEWPLGGLCFYYRHQPNEPYWLYLIQFGSPMFVDTDERQSWLETGTQYVFRIRAEPVDAQQSRYSCKGWRATEAEPLEWHVSALLPRRSGSLLLVSDHADVTFGRVSARSTGQ
jgi:regulation of enolase protein 1 (concanavalin A-like superfamily)